MQPAEALELLSRGALRGPADGAWYLFEQAWPVLLQRLTTFLRSLGVPREIGEDCGQNALLRVWRFRKSYRGGSPGELLAWIYRICQTESLRQLERESRAPRTEGELFARADRDEPAPDPLSDRAGQASGDSTGESVEERELHRVLEECLGELSERHRPVMALLYSGDETTEREAARILGRSKTHVNTLRRESLEKLRGCLRRKGLF